MKKSYFLFYAAMGAMAGGADLAADAQKKPEAKPADDNDFELPTTAATGAACGLGDGAACEACQ